MFALARQRVAPQLQASPVRETARLVCVSLALNVVVLMLFGSVRAIWPSITPDVGRLVREPAAYLKESYLAVTWWTIGLLGLATALAAVIGSIRTRHVAPHESASSAWWLMFEEKPGRRIHVGCAMEDGSFISGLLASFNTSIDETGDRDLVLAAPIRFRAGNTAAPTTLTDTSGVIISARRVISLFVTYQAHPAQERDASADQP
ncbi:hypothetical protein SAMN04488074_117114 [Lentzea albidocapillata subsp. violacea]|uniref:Uncharacterized protein n=2 Tax=Lentzea albidocapillata TaxID=40571 RepID=A0A1G9QZ76_9PSEU|nr:hypothetical protein SAMN04488074_117114 [Lentzea albidocapillata subsp. violacea]